MVDVLKAILHIGTEKTGTKSLQEFLHRNRSELLNRRIVYTKSAGARNNRQLAVAAYPLDRRDDATLRLGIGRDDDLLAHQQRVIDELTQEIDVHNSALVLFSSEHLQSRLRNRDDISRLRKVLTEIGLVPEQIIVYLRDPVAICRSLYASSVATGSTSAEPPPPTNAYFAHICDHRRTLERWSSVFGSGTICPRLFEKGTLIGNSIIDDFCEVADLGPINKCLRPQRRNESLSQLGVEVLRRINCRLPKFVDGVVDETRSRLVELVRQHCTGPAYVPPPEVAAQYRRHFAESNEWVCQHYFPEREQLFSDTALDAAPELHASDAELDAMADLIIAAWKAVH